MSIIRNNCSRVTQSKETIPIGNYVLWVERGLECWMAIFAMRSFLVHWHSRFRCTVSLSMPPSLPLWKQQPPCVSWSETNNWHTWGIDSAVGRFCIPRPALEINLVWSYSCPATPNCVYSTSLWIGQMCRGAAKVLADSDAWQCWRARSAGSRECLCRQELKLHPPTS